MIPFVKMHGCGNDFVVVRRADLDALALDANAQRAFVRVVCDRHFGVGADGLLAYATDGSAHVTMLYWNSDGGRAEMCGNGARCVVRLAFERNETTSPLVLTTDSGDLAASVHATDDAQTIEVCMGHVRWDAAAVGLAGEAEFVDEALAVGNETLRVTALSMGNPHAVVFLDDLEALAKLDLERVGAALSRHALFRHGANASFAVVRRDGIHVRVWERGSGATLACGTAACAVVAATTRLGRLEDKSALVHLPGGTVEVRIETEGVAWLRGPAESVAEGRLDPGLVRRVREMERRVTERRGTSRVPLPHRGSAE